MTPNFTKFEFKRANKGVEANKENVSKEFDLGYYDAATGSMSLIVEWKDTPAATACLITSPDKQVWRITAELVPQT